VLAVENVLYGTNRKPGPTTADGQLTFGSDAGPLRYGMTQVTIPKGHKYGEIEKPVVIRIGPLVVYKEHETPARHFTIMTNKALTEAGFKSALAGDTTKRALVYIHGYKTSFKNAAFTTAQIAYDIQFKGTPVFFSWPSANRYGAYFADNDKALAAAPLLAKFLREVRAGVGPKGEIFLIAHSLGNLALLEALDELSKSAVPGPPAKEVIFAAPDVDKSVFLSRIAASTKEGQDMTLYASAGDKALLASAALREGAPRAGLVVNGTPVIVTKGVQTIDVSAVSTDFFDLNHGTYDENRVLLGDIGELIDQGIRPPDKRSNIMRPVKDGAQEYWRIPY
jgi:esterase/lipase superfamily enzyme